MTKEQQPVLTEATYRERRADLVDQIREARFDHLGAALNAETGDGSPEATAAARAIVDALEDRVMGLDAAWEHAQRVSSAKAADDEAKRRVAGLALCEAELGKRADAAAAIMVAVSEIGAAVRSFDEASGRIVDTIKSFRPTFGPSYHSDLRDVSRVPDFMLIGGALYGAGVCIDGVPMRDWWFRSQERGLVEHVALRNRAIGNRLAAVLGDEAEAVP